jgi:hypothetical protein
MQKRISNKTTPARLFCSYFLSIPEWPNGFSKNRPTASQNHPKRSQKSKFV